MIQYTTLNFSSKSTTLNFSNSSLLYLEVLEKKKEGAKIKNSIPRSVFLRNIPLYCTRNPPRV
jgi:hypothetical protein